MPMPQQTKNNLTMSVLDQLKAGGAPKKKPAPSDLYQNDETGEPAPAEDDAAQGNFDADMSGRVKQDAVNKMTAGNPVTAGAYQLLHGAGVVGNEPGPTGMAGAGQGVTPYAPDYSEKRMGVSALKQPAKKKKPEDDDDTADRPVEVTGAY